MALYIICSKWTSKTLKNIIKTALRNIAEIHTGDFRLTPNQNLVIANVSADKKPEIEKIIAEYGITDGENYTGLRRNSMACVAFPTCGLAMAESERYLPSLISKIENLLDEAGLNEEITIRMTGCPNGCETGISKLLLLVRSRQIQYVFGWRIYRR